ncbi:amidohydrolase [Stappia sp. BW2]|jgi:hippurate hydrolase|uniref:M20 aminoacylase family protein n=1 Tax=Stappia sp. BW2 TaxID=2592622 RepID=UPI0011DE897D|nr:M20 aminoacylase family protein [Stappia sp. BW2]TYC63031.1 amidohydrolase [Stappia sp. BW2]
MAIKNRFADLLSEISAWRRDIHANPELGFTETRTAGKVAELLRSFGCEEVVENVGKTGVVAVIKGRGGEGKSIALRADMDALPITELTGVEYASVNQGKMHACGHDGHTAMLLGAAKYLSETRNFAGQAVLIFQPGEEGCFGARCMLEDGLLERWNIDEVYGMHNWPGMPVGSFAGRAGPNMAAVGNPTIKITGKGGHAAEPHDCIDPMPVAAQIIMACQTIVSRNADPLESLVISLTNLTSDSTARNVIPETVEITGTVRALSDDMMKFAEKRIGEICAGLALSANVKIEFSFAAGYPVTVNDPASMEAAVAVAREIAGAENVDDDMAPSMGAEDFAYFLQKRPGAFINLGNGDSAGLHSPYYNFNDEAIPFGSSWLVGMVEARSPLS